MPGRKGPLASLGHVTKGELCREQALVSWCSRTLCCLYQHAEDDGYITPGENPARKVDKPRRLPSTRRAVTDDRLAPEWRAEVQACPQAGDQQQRPAGSVDRGAQPDLVGRDVDEPDGPAVRRRRWHR